MNQADMKQNYTTAIIPTGTINTFNFNTVQQNQTL